MEGFTKNVFVNCPFDNDYRPLFISILFTVKKLGLTPRYALERNDSGEVRIHKILDLIKESKFGIHDLSRIIAVQENEHYRMNMPFELGIDFACQKLMQEPWASKKLLILEEQKYRYQKALSDLSGSDIKSHSNDPIKVIKAVRSWFVPSEIKRAPSHNSIWVELNDFYTYLHEELVVKDAHESIDEIEITEVVELMVDWFESN